MAKQGVASMLAVALVLVALALAAVPAVHSIGVCNGVHGRGLPAPSDVVKLYQSNRINAMRIYAPESKVLTALSGTRISVLMDVGDALPGLASSSATAEAWVKANVQAFPGVSFRYIAVGNEVMDSAGQKTILPAMRNMQRALAAAGLAGIKVSTSVRFDVFNNTSPPSFGVLADKSDFMRPILDFLDSTGAPLLVNVYPYFAYKDNPTSIDLNYATFQPGPTTVPDNGLNYKCLFDAMVDAVYAALKDAGKPGIKVVVSESGWPSAGGGSATSKDNAQKYNQGLINHVGNGTPKRPGPLETYIFAMFNENQKDGDETEKNFGLFNGPDKKPVYSITF